MIPSTTAPNSNADDNLSRPKVLYYLKSDAADKTTLEGVDKISMLQEWAYSFLWPVNGSEFASVEDPPYLADKFIQRKGLLN